ncbi:MAG: hypothetical protein ACRD1L_14630 [Terriglobales bacterium]
MPPTEPSAGSSFEDAARRVEAEVRRLIATFNDDVVPSLRQDGGKALRLAAEKLAKLADTLDRSRSS